VTAIDDMVKWALSQDGKAYSEASGKRCGPDSFDCSGFAYSACVAANLRPPGGTTGGCGSSDTYTQWPDRSSNGNTAIKGSGPFVKGDLIYFNNGAGGAQPGHVGIAIDSTSMINALNTQYGVLQCPISWGGTPMGAIRLPGGTTAGGGGDNNASTSSSDSSSSSSSDSNSPTTLATLANSLSDVPDPRDNLPFSAYFQGQRSAVFVPGQSGSFAFTTPGINGSIMPATTLVRGGITELNVQGSSANTFVGRPRGNFKCYFMMNPQTISYDMNINTDIMPASQQSAALQNEASYLLTQETITFTIVFNRMYEVWAGNVHNPHGGPGPSDIGCRWDMRAMERLMGMYDATQDPTSKQSTTVGVGSYGAGSAPPQSLPVQVVFGGSNSLQFQGQIAQLDYTYTLFDSRMIPIECTCDVGIMRLYNPTNSSAAIVNPLIKQYGQVGQFSGSNSSATFNGGTSGGGGLLVSTVKKSGSSGVIKA
jgi:hypothetical protein